MRNTNVTQEQITDVLNAVIADKELDSAIHEWYGEGDAGASFEEWLEPKIVYVAQQIQSGDELADTASIVEALRLNANAGLQWLKDHAAAVEGLAGVLSADTNTYVEDGYTHVIVWLRCSSTDAAEGAVAVIKTAMEAHGFAIEESGFGVRDAETTVVGMRKFGHRTE